MASAQDIGSNLIYTRAPTFHNTDNAYLLPNDTIEQIRLDKQHSALRSLLGNRIFRAPVRNPKLIFDIGCGTGAVTRELGTAFPSASIYGIDLSPNPSSASSNTGSNVSFITGDARKLIGTDARLPFNSADFIFNRLLLCGMTDWPGYVRDVFKMVKPGGWVEMQDFEEMFYFFEGAGENGEVTSTSSKGLSEWRWLRAYREGATAKGMDLDCGKNIRQYMIDAGFVDVEAKEFVAPYWTEVDAIKAVTTFEISELLIGDPDGYFWHAFPRMVDGLSEFGKEDVANMRVEMMKCLDEKEGKYQKFWSTVGRKPEN